MRKPLFLGESGLLPSVCVVKWWVVGEPCRCVVGKWEGVAMKPWRSSTACFSLVIVAVVCLVLTGCTAVKKAPPATKKTTEPYRVEKEGHIPPLATSDIRKEVDREESFEDLPVSEEPIEVETVEPVIEAPTPSGGSPGVGAAPGPAQTPAKTMDGYRVQLFASGSETAAESARQTAEVRLGVATYVELIDGIYKVRVGDCPTREEAEVLLKKCREAGYGDAWVATGQILLPPRRNAP